MYAPRLMTLYLEMTKGGTLEIENSTLKIFSEERQPYLREQRKLRVNIVALSMWMFLPTAWCHHH